ncbi:hypothetical protein HOD75_01835 [archaeon]|jgi:hypothetical protein|nr:hypothetical protein [archaeon]MBT4241618.1 hypothetical protein [archaeon]MBT4418013.1 hypothetical protein [archaeon]
MVKGEKLLFFRVLGVITILFLANASALFYSNESFHGGLTGFSVVDDAREIYTSMSGFSKIFLVIPWIILIFLLVRVAMLDRKVTKEAKEIHSFNIKHSSNKEKTDLDILYEILQKTKIIKISTISKAFKVDEEAAMEWCKILESANLAIIDYPIMRKPILKLVEKKSKIVNKGEKIINKKQLKNKLEGDKEETSKSLKKPSRKERNLMKGLRKGQSPLPKKKEKQNKKQTKKQTRENKKQEKIRTKEKKKKTRENRKIEKKADKIVKKTMKENSNKKRTKKKRKK